MGLAELLGGSGSEDDEGTDETTYWCTVCGMLFERPCLRIDYSWCPRCETGGVRKFPWPTPE